MTTTVAMEGLMAKKRGRPKQPTGEGSQVRIDSDLASMARYLAARRSVPISTYLSEILRPAIERDFRKAGQELKPGGEEK